MSDKPPHRFDLSPARLSLLSSCPWSYHLRYLAKSRRRPGATRAMRAGSAVHHAIARSLLPSSSTHGAARVAAVVLGRAQGALDLTRHLGAKASERAREIAKSAVIELPRVRERWAEVWIEAILGPAKVAGRADLVDLGWDAVCTVRDWKCAEPPAKFLDGGLLDDPQAGFYLAGLRLRFPRAASIEAAWHYLPSGVVIRATAPADHVARFKERVAALWAIVRSGRYPATPSYPVCRSCQVRHVCAYRVRRPPEEIPCPTPT